MLSTAETIEHRLERSGDLLLSADGQHVLRLRRRIDASAGKVLFVLAQAPEGPLPEDPEVVEAVWIAHRLGYGEVDVVYLASGRDGSIATGDTLREADAVLMDCARAASVVICAWGDCGYDLRGIEAQSLILAAGKRPCVLGVDLHGRPLPPRKARLARRHPELISAPG